ncbi:MAG TPA: HDIG domain-containing protein [Trueperaceae bacterium]
MAAWLARILNRKTLPSQLDMTTFAPRPEGGLLVGGAVRDALLGRPPADLDWLVADPEVAARAAADALDGSVFPLDDARGHWRVVTKDAVRDYIRPVGSLEADLAARDFTINAMAADPTGRLIDPLGGRADLRARQLRMVAPANLRNDPLRALRAVRLVVQLGLEIAPDTQRVLRELAASQQAGELPLPAWERAGEELNKLLVLPAAAEGIRLLQELGFLEVYLPELARLHGVTQGGYHHLDALAHSLEALRQLLAGFPDASRALRWATLLHDLGKADTRQAETSKVIHFYGHDKLGAMLARRLLQRLRQPAELTRKVEALVRYHMLPLPKNRREARRFVHRRRTLLPELLELMIADREAARGPMSSEASRQAYRMALARVLEILAELPPRKPLLDGREIMALLDLPPGPRVGEAIRFVAEAEAVGDIASREEAEAALQRYAVGQGWTDEEG